MHLLSDCRKNNNLTKRSGLCKAGWPVNKKPGKEFGGGGAGGGGGALKRGTLRSPEVRGETKRGLNT